MTRLIGVTYFLVWIFLTLSSLAFADQDNVGNESTGNEKSVLTIHGAANRTVIESLFKAFEAQYPNVKIHYIESNTRDLYEGFLSQPETRADIIMSPAMDLQFKLANDGFALAYRSPELELLPIDSHWRNELFGFTYEPIVTAINTDILGADALPLSREQLLNLIRKKNHLLDEKMGLFNIKKSGVGYLAWTYDGQQSRSYGRLLEAFGNHQAQLYTDTSSMLQALLKGQVFVAYNLIGAYSYKWSEQYPWIKTIMPTDYTSVIMRTAFIYRDTKQPRLSKRFIDFLLSPLGQHILANQSGLTPISIKAVGPYSRDALSKLPHGIFRPIPLGLELLIQTDDAKKQLIYNEWDNAMHPVSESFSSP
mgnify:CR=1 FL=1